jgi:hypothetical protein
VALRFHHVPELPRQQRRQDPYLLRAGDSRRRRGCSAHVQLGFRGTCCYVPWFVRCVLEDRAQRCARRLPATATALGVREDCRWTSCSRLDTVRSRDVPRPCGRSTHDGDSLVGSRGQYFKFSVTIYRSVLFIPIVCVCNVQRAWAHRQVRRAYPDFIAELDRLTPEDVVWEPYTMEAVLARAPLGLSPLCTAHPGLWFTTVALVYDIAVEAHCPHRVRRQFGQRQLYPEPNSFNRVPRHDHR